MANLNYNSPFISQVGKSGLARLGLISRYSPSYVRKLGRESSEQVIKLLVRSFRRLRLFFCGFLRGQPPHGMHLRLQNSCRILNQPQSVLRMLPEKLSLSSTAEFNWSVLAQITLHDSRFITCPIFFFQISTFVVKLFTFRDAYFDLSPRARPIHSRSNQRHTVTIN